MLKSSNFSTRGKHFLSWTGFLFDWVTFFVELQTVYKQKGEWTIWVYRMKYNGRENENKKGVWGLLHWNSPLAQPFEMPPISMVISLFGGWATCFVVAVIVSQSTPWEFTLSHPKSFDVRTRDKICKYNKH